MRSPRRLPVLQDEFSQEEAAWLLASFCALQRKSFDATLFLQRYPAPIAASALEQAADELELEFKRRECSLSVALDWRLPAAVRLRGENESLKWAFILNADETRASILEHGAPAPIAISLTELRSRYSGEALSLTPKTAPAADPDSLEFRSARFGLRWFVPELLKHNASGATSCSPRWCCS